MEELATVAHTEDMVATLGATGPTEATMARERLNPQLLPKLKPIPTMALTAMVDMDCLTEATDVHTEDTAFLTDAAMATATEAMATPPEATADPIQSPVATDPTAAMALLTAATTTERRQHQTSIRILINMNWTK